MSDYVIETRGLTKTYGEQNSVSNLSIHVRKGRIYGLLGRNGAGKTTTMRMLLGLTAPSSGDVKIFGKPLRGNEKNILPRIGSLIESPGFYPNLTGTENLRIFADLRGLKSPKYIKGALEVVNLPYRDKKLFSQYSLGMKQRLAIALAVMHNPELLILDEPINGLDPIGIAEVRGFIRELCDATGKTILISSQILKCHRIVTFQGVLIGNSRTIVTFLRGFTFTMEPSKRKVVELMTILQTTDLKKYYGDEPNITKALDGVSLSVELGEFVAIIGTSGSGKSTLLNMIGGLDVPTSGKVIVDGRDLSTLNDEQLTIFRRRKIGFIFQNYNLVPVLNVYENITLPVELDGDKVDKKFMQEIVRMLALEDILAAFFRNCYDISVNSG